MDFSNAEFSTGLDSTLIQSSLYLNLPFIFHTSSISPRTQPPTSFNAQTLSQRPQLHNANLTATLPDPMHPQPRLFDQLPKLLRRTLDAIDDAHHG